MFGASDPASNKTVNIRPISKFSRVSANSCKIQWFTDKKKPKTFIFTKIQPLQTQTKWWLILASVTPLATKSHKSLFWWQKTYIITVRRIPKPKTQICSTVLLELSTKIHLDFKFWRTHTKTSHYFHTSHYLCFLLGQRLWMMLKNLAIAAASVVCENSPWCQAGLTGFSGISLAAGGGVHY